MSRINPPPSVLVQRTVSLAENALEAAAGGRDDEVIYWLELVLQVALQARMDYAEKFNRAVGKETKGE